VSVSPEAIAMVEAQARTAITAKRDDAPALFEAYVALAAAARVAPSTDAPKEIRLATKPDLKKLLGVASDRTIECMVKDGRIPAAAVVRVGRLIRFDLALVLEALRPKTTAAMESRGAAWAKQRSRMRAIAGGAA
jgi:excisionase family DNA binding protein